MKRLFWLVIGIIVGVVLTVLYIPGVSGYIEDTVLGWVSGWAS